MHGFFSEESELARAVRSRDWSQTALGGIETWPEALLAALSICLGSRSASFVIWGPDRVQLYNDAALGLIRGQHPDALGRPMRETWSELCPDLVPAIERVLRTGESALTEPLTLPAEGGDPPEQALVRLSLNAIHGRARQPLGVFMSTAVGPRASQPAPGHTHAEAALRQSEERFRAIVHSARDYAIFLTDARGVITEWPEGAERVKGYEAAEALGQPISIFYTPEDIAAGEPERELAEAAREGRVEREAWRVRKGGERFWVNEISTVVRDAAGNLVGFARVARDLTDKKRAEEALAGAHAELEERVAQRTLELALTNRVLKNEVAQRRRAERLRRDLLRRLDNAQEDERRRVARDLHDQVGQTLTALTLAVKATRDTHALPQAVSAHLSEVQRAAEELGREVHELAVRLRPTALDDLGLHAALGQLLSNWSAQTRIELDCQLADLETARLPPDFETVLYRVVQEALTNVARHARAARASVVVQRVNGSVLAVVEDDGVGFEPEASSDRLGLLGLSERVTLAGGTLNIESKTGHGTTLIARLPC